jgi:hypothetical protein
MRDEERELATDAHNEVGMTMRKIRAARWNGSRRVEFNVPATRSVARHNDHLEILIELDVVLPLSALRVTRRSYRCICAVCRRLLSSGSPLREISCHNQPETKRDRYAIHAPGLDMWDEPAKISSSIWRREGRGSP